MAAKVQIGRAVPPRNAVSSTTLYYPAHERSRDSSVSDSQKKLSRTNKHRHLSSKTAGAEANAVVKRKKKAVAEHSGKAECDGCGQHLLMPLSATVTPSPKQAGELNLQKSRGTKMHLSPSEQQVIAMRRFRKQQPLLILRQLEEPESGKTQPMARKIATTRRADSEERRSRPAVWVDKHHLGKGSTELRYFEEEGPPPQRRHLSTPIVGQPKPRLRAEGQQGSRGQTAGKTGPEARIMQAPTWHAARREWLIEDRGTAASTTAAWTSRPQQTSETKVTKPATSISQVLKESRTRRTEMEKNEEEMMVKRGGQNEPRDMETWMSREKAGPIQRIYATSPLRQIQQDATGRLVCVVRNAESLGDTFPQWINRCFSSTDCHSYCLRDCNQPQQLPVRPGGPAQYVNDPPITEIGIAEARLVGRGLAMDGVQPTAVFASPALRCVQTAHYILAQMQSTDVEETQKIKVEPALIECSGRYPQIPAFLTPEEMAQVGLNVDVTYKPMLRLDSPKIEIEMPESETTQEADKRQKICLGRLLKEHPAPNHILLVGHCSTMETALHLLLGTNDKIPEVNSYDAKMMKKNPNCALLTFEEMNDKTWNVKEVSPPQTPLSQQSFSKND